MPVPVARVLSPSVPSLLAPLRVAGTIGVTRSYQEMKISGFPLTGLIRLFSVFEQIPRQYISSDFKPCYLFNSGLAAPSDNGTCCPSIQIS